MSEQTSTKVILKTKLKRPPKYNVIFHNDDITTMEFVVYLLTTVFFMETEAAVNVMLKVHNEGAAIVGTYEYDIAVSKKKRADKMSAQAGYPLMITVEQAKE